MLSWFNDRAPRALTLEEGPYPRGVCLTACRVCVVSGPLEAWIATLLATPMGLLSIHPWDWR
jgi:hypothetical protein